jgi:hypothetical protein
LEIPAKKRKSVDRTSIAEDEFTIKHGIARITTKGNPPMVLGLKCRSHRCHNETGSTGVVQI